MKKFLPKKLVLNRESLRVLHEVEVSRIRGGASTGEVNCPLVTASAAVATDPAR